jgi:hypothetical protein
VRQRVDSWVPDLMVCDEVDFGAMLAAEQAGIPRVVVGVIASGALTRLDHIREPLAQRRAVHGLHGLRTCAMAVDPGEASTGTHPLSDGSVWSCPQAVPSPARPNYRPVTGTHAE